MPAPVDAIRRRPVASLTDALTSGAAERTEVGVLGPGSNLLLADEGVRHLDVKRDRDLSHLEHHGGRPECGGVVTAR